MKQSSTFINKFAKTAARVVAILGLAFFSSQGILQASADSPVFNSNPQDRPTLQVSGDGGNTYATTSSITPGETLTFFIWDHNNVPGTTATNVNMSAILPTGFNTTFTPSATVSASNASSVTGTVSLNASQAVSLSYKAGSAVFYRVDPASNRLVPVGAPNGVNVNNVINPGGVNVGDQQGCFQYTQAITFQAVVNGGSAAIATQKAVQLTDVGSFGTNPVNANPGDHVSFRIHVANTGTGTGMHPKIVDVVDPHLKYVAGSSYTVTKVNNTDVKTPLLDSLITFTNTAQGQQIIWAFQDMPASPDSDLYLIFQTVVTSKDTFTAGTTTKIPNCAVSSFDSASANTNCVEVDVTTSATPVFAFTVTKQVIDMSKPGDDWHQSSMPPGVVAPGDKLQYKLTVVNTGNTAADNVILKDMLPSGITFNGNVKLYDTADNGTAVAGNDIVNNGLTIAHLDTGNPNEKIYTFDAQVTNDCSGTQTLDNQVQVIYASRVQATDHVAVTFACQAGLIITKTVKGPNDTTYKHEITNVHEGQDVTFDIKVQNNSNVWVKNPVLKDILPKDITADAGSLAEDGVFQTDPNLLINLTNGTGLLLTNLPPGGVKEISFNAHVSPCYAGNTQSINSATVTADGVAALTDTAVVDITIAPIGSPSL